MGYGGPRVQFYTASHYANYTAAIQQEDAARVRSIVHRRTSVPEAEQLRQREAAFREYEAAHSAEAARLREEETQSREARDKQEAREQHRRTARRSRQARLAELSRPRAYPDAATVTLPLGSITQPVGRNNTVYAPGVDRDRLVPARPTLGSGTTAPWVGSYSTHHGPREQAQAAAREEAAYYCSQPVHPQSAQETAKRQKALRGIVAAHAVDRPQQAAEASAELSAPVTPSVHASATQYDEGADAESVFSHGSSNGPICATGNAHMSTVSTKDGVQLHLSRYGGAMTAPRSHRAAETTSVKDLTLPELSHRLVKMQAPAPRLR